MSFLSAFVAEKMNGRTKRVETVALPRFA